MKTCGALTTRSGQRPMSRAMPSSRMRKYVSCPERERPSMRKRGVCSVKKSLSSSGGLLLETLLHRRHELLVAGRIDERIRLLADAPHPAGEVEEAAVRAEEDVARERLQRGEGAAVVVDRAGIARVAGELVLRGHARAADEDDVVHVAALAHGRRPRGAAAGVAGSDVRG